MTARPLVLTASILSLEPSAMHDRVAAVASELDAVQLDIMDGRFVSSTTYGAEIAASVDTSLPLDIHLMVADPADRLAAFQRVGASHVTFHAEAVPATADRRALIAAIRNGGATAGIAINPGTPVSAIDDVASEVDLVLVMSVEPGKGGQAFIPSITAKIEALRRAHPGLMLQVDGGINAQTAPACIAAGADNLVIGSALFNAPDPALYLRSIRHAAA